MSPGGGGCIDSPGRAGLMQDMSGETARSCQFFRTWHPGSPPFPSLLFSLICLPCIVLACVMYSLRARCPIPSPSSLGWGGCLSLQGLVGSEAFGGGLWRLGHAGRCPAGRCPAWASGLFGVPRLLQCSGPFSLGALTTSVMLCWWTYTRSPCRLSCMFFTQHTDVLSLLVFTIVFQTRDSGLMSSHHLIKALSYNVCVPLIQAILMGLVMFCVLTFA